MLQIKTEKIIDRSVEKVWHVLTNFIDYPNWNPFIPHITGEFEEGKTISVKIAPPQKKPMRFTPKILKLEKNKELRWVGKLLFSFLFTGEHYFMLEPINENQTKLIHGEIFSGLLVPLLKKDLTGATQNGFIEMNEALNNKLNTI